MNAMRPEFHLQKVGQGGRTDPLEICTLAARPGPTRFSRRDLLAAGVSIACAAAVMRGSAEVLAAAEPAANTKQRARAVFAHTKAVESLAFSPDGVWLVSGGADHTAKIWRIADGGLESTLDEHKSTVYSVRFTPDGKLLATASGDKKIRLWDMPGGKRSAEVNAHADAVGCLEISPLGNLMASASAQGQVRLWSIPDGRLLETLKTDSGAVKRLAITPDGKTVIGGGRGRGLQIWSLPDGQWQRRLEDPNIQVFALAVSGSLVASAGTAKTVSIRSTTAPDELTTLSYHKGWIRALAISPDGRLMASMADDKGIVLWELPKGELIQSLLSPFGFRCAAISPNGECLAAGDPKGVITLWNLRGRSLRGFLFDPLASAVDAIVYHTVDPVSRQRLTYTVPCGEPLPEGAVCTCNCVPGRLSPQVAEAPKPAKLSGKGDKREEIAQARQILRENKQARASARASMIAQQQLAAAQAYNFYLQNYLAHRPSLSGRNCNMIGAYRGGVQTICRCDQVCTCVPVSY